MQRVLSIACLMLCLFALTAGAAAQEDLNFADLPLVSVPVTLPNGYGQFEWSNFFYVDPFSWSGASPGDLLGPSHQDIGFIGSRVCRLVNYACFGTLTNIPGFQLVSATVAGSNGPTVFTVIAYNHGNFVGQANYFVTNQLRTLTFPQQWGIVTQVVFQVSGAASHLTFYDIRAYTIGQ